MPLHLQVSSVNPKALRLVEAAGGSVERVYYTRLGLKALLKVRCCGGFSFWSLADRLFVWRVLHVGVCFGVELGGGGPNQREQQECVSLLALQHLQTDTHLCKC